MFAEEPASSFQTHLYNLRSLSGGRVRCIVSVRYEVRIGKQRTPLHIFQKF